MGIFGDSLLTSGKVRGFYMELDRIIIVMRVGRSIKMYTQPISEDDPMYYEKESNRLMQEQLMIAGNLMEAFIKALPEVLETSQKILEFVTWKSLIGEEKASELYPEHAKLWQEHNNRLARRPKPRCQVGC